MSIKSYIKFCFTESPTDAISGVAFEEDGKIVASFKLKVGKTSVNMHGACLSCVTLKMVSGAPGVKIHDIFDDVLSKYGEREPRYPTGRVGRVYSRWRICNDRVKEAIEELKEILEGKK